MTIGHKDFLLISTIAQERHFGHAAQRLGMRQPQLSIRVAELEQRLGVVLFERRPAIAPTAAGEVIIEAAQTAMSGFQAALTHARRLANGQMGSLVVAVASSVMLSDLPGSIRRFREQWPDIALSMRDMHSTQQLDALLRGQIDVAITREPPTDRAITAEVLGYQRFVALLPQSHALAGRASINLRELAEEDFVLFAPQVAPGLLDQIHGFCRKYGFSPRVAQQAEEWYTILGFVRAGFGITIALDIFGESSWPGIVPVGFGDENLCSPIYLCWSIERPAPSRDILIEWIRNDTSLSNAWRPDPGQ